MSSKKAKSADEANLAGVYERFIDILFAVVIGQSFVLLSSGAWFASWLAQPTQNAFGIATLILVYTLLITSWVGYHQSIQQFPIKSVWRFLIDITLLFLYYMGFANAGNFYTITWIFVSAFVLYTVWDAVRLVEYRDQRKDRRELAVRLGVSFGFAAGFVAVALVYPLMTSLMSWTEGAFFVIIALLLFLYRYAKRYRRSS